MFWVVVPPVIFALAIGFVFRNRRVSRRPTRASFLLSLASSGVFAAALLPSYGVTVGRRGVEILLLAFGLVLSLASVFATRRSDGGSSTRP